MTTPQPTGRFSGRTKLITIASIVAVAAAGAFAVSANIGILNASGSTNVGTLSASGDLAPPNSQVVDVYIDDKGTTTATTTTTAGVTVPTALADAGVAAPAIQRFAVDAAGTVALVATGTAVRLESVSPAAGWTWTLAQTQPTALTVTLTDGARTLEFTATLGADGTIAATVNEPTSAALPPAAAPSNGGQATSHTSYEGGGDDD